MLRVQAWGEGLSGQGRCENRAETQRNARGGLNLAGPVPPIPRILQIPTHLPMSGKSEDVGGGAVDRMHGAQGGQVGAGECCMLSTLTLVSGRLQSVSRWRRGHLNLPCPYLPLSHFIPSALIAARLNSCACTADSPARQQACQQTLTLRRLLLSLLSLSLPFLALHRLLIDLGFDRAALRILRFHSHLTWPFCCLAVPFPLITTTANESQYSPTGSTPETSEEHKTRQKRRLQSAKKKITCRQLTCLRHRIVVFSHPDISCMNLCCRS